MRPQPNGNVKPLRHIIIVREDLPLGIAGANIAHAAGESCEGPLPTGTYAIVLGCKNEDHLLAKAQLLWDGQIPHKIINEPDEPYNGEAMAIGIWPTRDDETVRRFISDLPLFGKKKKN